MKQENSGLIVGSQPDPQEESQKEPQNERQQTYSSYPLGTPKIVIWVIEHSGGLIKSVKLAQYTIMGFVVVSFIITFYLFFGGNDAEQEYFAPLVDAPPAEVIPRA